MKKLFFFIYVCILVLSMQTNAQGVELIKKAEGFSSKPYICPAGKLTVGYGHTGNVNGPVTKEQAEALLKKDLRIAEEAIKQSVKVPLNPNQFSALVSFVYNVGVQNFKNSTLLRILNRGRYEEAALQFDRWVHANGTVLEGLKKRRAAEKQLFLKEVNYV